MHIDLTPGSGKKSYSGAATVNEQSFVLPMLEGFAASLSVANMDRSDVDETLDVKIQHSPDDRNISDGDAIWYDLVSFTQVTDAGASTEFKSVSGPNFGRLRVVVTLGGTSPSADVQVIIEGPQSWKGGRP